MHVGHKADSRARPAIGESACFLDLEGRARESVSVYCLPRVDFFLISMGAIL